MNFLSISSQRLDSKKYPPSQRFKHQGIVLVTIQKVIVTFFRKEKRKDKITTKKSLILAQDER